MPKPSTLAPDIRSHALIEEGQTVVKNASPEEKQEKRPKQGDPPKLESKNLSTLIFQSLHDEDVMRKKIMNRVLFSAQKDPHLRLSRPESKLTQSIWQFTYFYQAESSGLLVYLEQDKEGRLDQYKETVERVKELPADCQAMPLVALAARCNALSEEYWEAVFELVLKMARKLPSKDRAIFKKLCVWFHLHRWRAVSTSVKDAIGQILKAFNGGDSFNTLYGMLATVKRWSGKEREVFFVELIQGSFKLPEEDREATFYAILKAVKALRPENRAVCLMQLTNAPFALPEGSKVRAFYKVLAAINKDLSVEHRADLLIKSVQSCFWLPKGSHQEAFDKLRAAVDDLPTPEREALFIHLIKMPGLSLSPESSKDVFYRMLTTARSMGSLAMSQNLSGWVSRLPEDSQPEARKELEKAFALLSLKSKEI